MPPQFPCCDISSLKEKYVWIQLNSLLLRIDHNQRIRNSFNISSVLPMFTVDSSGISTRHFLWTQEATQSFLDLKLRFTCAPILTQSDPELQFIVEVDASDTGVGAVLSQRSPKDGKLIHVPSFPANYLLRRGITTLVTVNCWQ